MPEQTPGASPATITPRHLRPRPRLRSIFCRFHAIGRVNRLPTYNHTRRGQASAIFSIITDEDRDLDLLIFDRDEPTLRHRLDHLHAGATVYVEGTVRAPRLSQRELPQFIADDIILQSTTDGQGPRPPRPRPGTAKTK